MTPPPHLHIYGIQIFFFGHIVNRDQKEKIRPYNSRLPPFKGSSMHFGV